MKKRTINPPMGIYKKIALSFIILTFILIAVIFYFTLSYVYITITPKVQDISSDFNFIIVENQSAQNATEGIFNGQIVSQTLNGEKTFGSTGTMQLSGEMVGNVKLINNLSRNQILIAKTRLLSADGILFRLKSGVDIPAKGSLYAAVYPDDPSKPFAKAGTQFTIPGLNANSQKLVYAVSEEDFKAAGQIVKVLTKEDLDKALNNFSNDLANQIFTTEEAGRVKVLSKEIAEQSFSNKVGDQADKFTLSLKLKVTGVIFDDKPVKDFAQKILDGLVPADKQLISSNLDALTYKIEKYDLANKLVQLKSSLKGSVIISENSPILERDKLVKMSPDEIKSYLQNFPEIKSVEVGFFPGWFGKMPYFQDHIVIKINK